MGKVIIRSRVKPDEDATRLSGEPRAAIYLRVSTDEQAKYGESLAVQEERCRARVLSTGGAPVEIYRDDGYTAANTDRPAYQRMLDDLRAGKINQVVISKLDRISRSVRDFVNLCDEVEKLGGSIVSVSEDINTATAAGRLQRHVLVAMAEFERARIAERVTEVMDSRARRGLRNGGSSPFGYRLAEKGKLEPDPEAAPIVKEIFRLYVSGMGCGLIADELRRRGHRVFKSLILRMLRNATYTGQNKWRGEFVAGTHEPLVDRATFDETQKRMNANADMCVTRNREKSYEYQLDGLVYCGVCNRHMTTAFAKGRKDYYPYYRCVGEVRLKDCQAKAVNADALDRFVLDKIISWCEDPTEIAEALKKQRKATDAGLNLLTEQLALAQKEHAAVKRTMENLLAVAGSGKISPGNLAVFDEEMQKQRGILAHNDERINALTAEIEHQKESATGQPLKEQLAAVAEHLRNGTPEERRGWLRACVVRVTVHPDEFVIDTFLGKSPVYRNAPDGWPFGTRTWTLTWRRSMRGTDKSISLIWRPTDGR
jgi:site-specific DNA recombinase